MSTVKWEKPLGWKGEVPWMAENPPFTLIVQPWYEGREYQKFRGHIRHTTLWTVTIHDFFMDLESAKRAVEELSLRFRRSL